MVRRGSTTANDGTEPCRRRRPERTLLYRAVQTHFATWLALAGEGDCDQGPAHVEREFRRYLECGILAHGFARARCGLCGYDFLLAFSCKARAVCPACNARRMVETAAHLTDHVVPRLPVRQWVLAVPKRLRYFLQRDADLQGAALRLFLRVVEQCLRARTPGAGTSARLGAVAFIHRFGSTLNDTRDMAQWGHDGGFSVDASVRIEATDHAGRERLLRHCARPPLALERLRELAPERLLYDSAKPGPGGNGTLRLTLVLVELVCVPEDCYRSDKAESIAIVQRFLRTKQFAIEDAETAWKALRLFETSRADFADCLIDRLGAAHECEYTATFDKGAAKAGMRLIV